MTTGAEIDLQPLNRSVPNVYAHGMSEPTSPAPNSASIKAVA
jgi:hypothetical protein